MEDEDFIGEDLNAADAHSLKQYARFADDVELSDDASVSVLDGIESMKPKVVNIVATADFGVELDLFNISSHIRNATYNPRRFQAVILRIGEPRATALIFKTGRINIVGCRREEDAELAARKFGRIIRRVGYTQLKLKAFTIANLVAVIACGFPVDLGTIARHPGHRKLASYNPEVFAGLIYKIPNPRVTLLIFSSGKIVMTGAKSRKMLMDAAEWIHPILQVFQKQDLALELAGIAEEAPPMPQAEEKKKKKKAHNDPFGFKTKPQ
jgi:transcription initiation factor TFIID TATA-box-binding protein